MKRTKLKVIITLALMLVMFIEPFKPAFQAAVVSQTYISDIKIGYSKDHSSKGAEAAKKALRDQGYNILDEDLNSGTGEGWSFIGYKTTNKKEEAITDIGMMDMKGGYEMSNYNEMLKKSQANLTDLAENLEAAAKEFKENYSAGSPAAQVAFEALNFIYVPEAGNQKLADYFMDPTRKTDDYYQIILKAHPEIISLIYSQLTLGTVDYNKENWLERFSKMDPYGDYDSTVYYDKTKPLYDMIEGFRKDVDKAIESFNQDKDKMTDDEKRFYSVYTTLNQYEYDGTPVGDFLINPYLNVSDLFPLAAALTDGQCGIMAISGIQSYVYVLLNTEESFEGSVETIKSQYDTVDGVSLWAGVDLNAFQDDIALTTEAYRKAASEKDFAAFTKTDTMNDTIKQAIKIVGFTALAAAAVATFAFIGMSLVLGCTIGITTIFSGIAVASTFGTIGAICSGLFVATGAIVVLAIIVVIVLAFVLLAQVIQDAIDYYHPTYTKIPKIMYDLETDSNGVNKYIRYEAVLDQNGQPGDLNTWQGLEWNALYITKDPLAGAPITGDFLVKRGDGIIPQGYSPLHMLGETTSVNTNKNTYHDKHGGVYLFFKREGENKVETRGKYLSDFIIETGSTAEEARSKILSKKGFQILEYPLVVFNGYYHAYAGYKTTNVEKDAIRDIRAAYKYESSNIYLGDSSYGKAGTIKDTTIYTSKGTASGSPILADFIGTDSLSKAPQGYEPVCLLSGGPAFDLAVGYKDYWPSENYCLSTYLYFKPSKTYDSGPDYVSGISFFASNYYDGNLALTRMSEMGYKNTGYDMMIRSGNRDFVYMGYSTTKNPYRALRKIYGYNNSDSKTVLSGGMSIGGIGYAATPTFSIDNGMDYDMLYEFRESYAYITSVSEFAKGKQTTAMYVASGTSQGVPFTYEQMIFSDKPLASIPVGYIPVVSVMDYTFSALNLKKGAGSDSFLYLYIPGSSYTKKKYIESLVLGVSEYSIGGAELSLFAGGCEESNKTEMSATLKKKDKDGKEVENKTYSKLGAIRTDNANHAITGIKLYMPKDQFQSPPLRKTFDGIEYSLVTDDSFGGNMTTYYITGPGGTSAMRLDWRKVYIYTTKNVSAGSPITSVSISNKAYAIDQEGAELVFEFEPRGGWDHPYELDGTGESYKLYFTRSTPCTTFISDIDAAWGDSQESAQKKLGAAGLRYYDGFNFNNSAGGDIINIAYNKTDNVSKGITGLTTVVSTEWNPQETITKNGIVYKRTKSVTDFNRNVGGDYIFLYYTKDPKAGAPLTKIICTDNAGLGGYEYVLDNYNQKSNFNSGVETSCDGAAPGTYMVFERATQEIINKASLLSSVFAPPSLSTFVLVGVVFFGFGGALIIINAAKKRKRKKVQKDD